MEKGSNEKQLNKYNSQRIIVITGAESTGKSTLTEQLANYYDVPSVPELARSYIENLNRKYTYSDVESIAKQQVKQLRRFIDSDYPFIFLDTWLIVTKIWFEVVYSKEPLWLINEIINTQIDLFLVCDTDIPWISDPVRENGGEMREKLQLKYIETIKKFNFRYKMVSGAKQERLKQAQHWLEELQ